MAAGLVYSGIPVVVYERQFPNLIVQFILLLCICKVIVNVLIYMADFHSYIIILSGRPSPRNPKTHQNEASHPCAARGLILAVYLMRLVEDDSFPADAQQLDVLC